jgi:protein-disulfide isomerase
MRLRWFTLASLPLLGILSASAQDRPTPDKYAEVNGGVISAEDVDRALGPALARVQAQIYGMRSQKLRELIQDRILQHEAKQRGVSVQQLLDSEIEGQVVPVSDADVEAFLSAHKEELREDDPHLKEQIKVYLRNQRVAARREDFLKSLQSAADVKMFMGAPPAFPVTPDAARGPSRGAPDAPITIVEFEDFQCPYCRRSQGVLTQLLSQYAGKIRVVHRDFPIDSLHPDARHAHEAARCAEAQGKFWPFHDALYSGPPELSRERVAAVAKQTGINDTAFESCLAAGTYRSEVDKDIKEGTDLGLTGTPTFFVNNRYVGGAQTFADFSQIIDGELARLKNKPATSSKLQ